MEKRLALAALFAGGGAFAWWMNRQGAGVYAPVNLDYAAPPASTSSIDAPATYLARLSAAEDPTGALYAKNPYSTGSGLYQFTKSTWTALGGDWGDDPSKAFGGLTPSAEEQTAMAEKLTAGNASILDRAGVAIDNLSLYAAHIFGPSVARRVLSADPSTALASLVGRSTAKKNPALGSTAASFVAYLQRTVGA